MTFDNLCTSLDMLNHLSENGTVGTGTLRASRTGHCPIKDLNVASKEDRGSYAYRYDSANKVIVVSWNDSNVITLASNCYKICFVPVENVDFWQRL